MIIFNKKKKQIKALRHQVQLLENKTIKLEEEVKRLQNKCNRYRKQLIDARGF